MNNLKNNKSFQTVVGAAVLYLGFVLWRDGWLELLWSRRNSSEGFAGPAEWTAIAATIGAALLNFTQMIGIATIGILSGVLPHVEDALTWLSSFIKKASLWAAGGLRDYVKTDKAERKWDWKPAALLLAGFIAWSGGHVADSINWIIDNIDVVEDLPRGEANGRPVPDGRDGHSGDLDFTPVTDDRGKIIINEDRTEIDPDDSRDDERGVVDEGRGRKKRSDKGRHRWGRLRLWNKN